MKALPVGILAALCSGPSFAGSAPPLFTEIFDASQPTPPRTLSSFPVEVNFPPLDANTGTLELQLPGSGTYTATRVRFEARPAGGYHWIGRTAIHDVVLTVDGDLITGFIRGGPDTYSILSTIEGGATSHTLMRMDAEAFPPDIVESDPAPMMKGAQPGLPEEQCFGVTSEPIDLLVVYSPETLDAAGGSVEVLHNQIANAVAGANVTLANGKVPATVDVAAIEPAPPDLIEERDTDDLPHARDNLELQLRRKLHKADITVYLTSAGLKDGQAYCGITRTQRRAGDTFWGLGYDFYDSAVLVLTHQCGIQNNDLSHEIGHNVGLDHNPSHAVGTQQTNLYTFSFGHHVNLHFRDDMSGSNAQICPQGCPRQMFFSDPAMFTDGIARGTNSRNNAETYRRMFRCTNTLADYVFVDNFE